ncbi:hypothetical protein ABZ807_21610 [Micromonospora sp. NPDC047548]|uniref:hypothetical protein n=1 Tax=Micromonospora sp. NPDC047548 TaxID=3155624 RepID=UPI0033E10374
MVKQVVVIADDSPGGMMSGQRPTVARWAVWVLGIIVLAFVTQVVASRSGQEWVQSAGSVLLIFFAFFAAPYRTK